MEYSSLTEGDGARTEARQNGDANTNGVIPAAPPSKPRSPISNGVGGGVSNGTSPTGIGSSANSVTSRGSLFSKRSKKSRSSRRSHRSGNTGDLSEPLTMASEGGGGDVEMGRRYGGGGGGGGGNTSDDPFHVFKEDLMDKLGLADSALASYLKTIHGTDTAVNSHEIKSAKKQLKRHIKHAESTLKDLQKTIKSVESRREQFPHISDDELNTRRVFVHGARDRLHRIKSDMASDEVREKMMQDERALTRRRMGNGVQSTAAGGQGVNGGSGHEDDALIVDQHAHAQMMLQEQDEALDDLDEAVENVGRMADEIHAELGTQNRMLTELEEDLSDAEEKLGLVMGKLAKLLKTKSKCQLGTILVLSFTVIILFFLVIYT